MTQAVSGVHRVWLVFSGLAFLVCGLLLVARFSRSASPPAAAVPSPAPGAVIHQQLSVPAGSAATGEADATAGRGGRPERTPEVVEPGKPQAHPTGEKKKADKIKDGHGRTSPRAPSTAKAGAFKPPTRGLDLNDPIAGSESPPPPPPPTRAPVGPGTTTRPATPDKSPGVGDTKPERIKPKHHKAPPSKEASEGATDAIPTPSSAGSRADKLVEGVLKVNAPTGMLVGESEHIRAVVGTKAHSDAVDKEASTDVGDGPRVQVGQAARPRHHRLR